MSHIIQIRGTVDDRAVEQLRRCAEAGDAAAVQRAHGDTIRITRRLTPIGVAMAGPDVYDPFKD